jgi:hypothetical protein
MQSGQENIGRLVPHLEMVEEEPSLEDMYIYYERQQ